MVEVSGFEPLTADVSDRNSNQLSYTSIEAQGSGNFNLALEFNRILHESLWSSHMGICIFIVDSDHATLLEEWLVDGIGFEPMAKGI